MNSVVHFEIPVDDNERAANFYKEVFGWVLNHIPQMNYTIAHTTPTDEKTQMPKHPGAINGGIYKRDEESAKTPVVVINVDNVDEHLKKIESAGGELVLGPRDVGDMGIYAQVKDTEGNIIGIWQTTKNSELPE